MMTGEGWAQWLPQNAAEKKSWKEGDRPLQWPRWSADADNAPDAADADIAVDADNGAQASVRSTLPW